MDPFTHTFAGGLMAAGGLRKITPLAAAALLIGANMPDVDIVVSLLGEQASVAHRRGWTHGVLAWIVLPLALTAGLLAWSKWFARGDAKPAFLPLLGLSLLAVLSHPLLDWLNNYGVRLLMPFDSRWFYGDTLFVLDPWIWLLFGGGYFYASSVKRWQKGLWALFWVVSSLVVCINDFSTSATIILWFAGLGGVLVLRWFKPSLQSASVARGALVIGATYIMVNGLAGHYAANQVATQLHAQQLPAAQDIMVAPVPANPLQGNVVIAYKDYYLLGNWRWTSQPHFTLNDQPLTANMAAPEVVAASKVLTAERFLSWSRYPYARVSARADGGYEVQFDDARYAEEEGLIRGPKVLLDANKKPL